ncbi:unnamed protein product [Cylindrotheca closterium]|uniref:Circumsporozoite protein n=1 Tax=Cylindrotheca closterium TaxID=2856 RepID=A0AAD2JJR0_9STRA|nr:unnamed protein product [Cylindrotheca closterium]
MVKIMQFYSICTFLLMWHCALGGTSNERTAFNSRRGVSGDHSSSSADYFEANRIFERVVYVDIDAGEADLAGLSLVSTSTLEHQFVQSFNKLSEELCDIEGLRILAANIQYTDASKTEYILRRGGNKYTIEFQVFATCDNCNPFSVTVFDHRVLTTRRTREIEGDVETVFDRQLSSKKSSKKSASNSSSSSSSSSSKKSGKGKGKGKGKGGKGSKKSGKGKGGMVIGDKAQQNGQVICTAKNPQFRAPTEEEFREVYSVAVRGLMTGSTTRRQLGRNFVVGGLLPIQAITKVYEVLDGRCVAAFEEFNSIVTIEVSGNFEAATTAEYLELAEAFFQNYNALQAHGCDKPLFREVSAVEITMATPDTDGNGFFNLVLNVFASCQGVGCTDDISLFSDFNVFRRLLTNTTLEVDDPCECPVSPNRKNAAPSALEMGILFDETLQELRASGLVTNFQTARIITEVGVQAISPAPSGMPTVSNAPSISNAPSTSVKPTGGPPTFSQSPSALGSARPSVSFAPSNSMAPSLSPTISNKPSVSLVPSSNPSLSGAPSGKPSDSAPPSQAATTSVSPSGAPSTSKSPSEAPSGSGAPSVSEKPSSNPTNSLVPSFQPSNKPSVAASGVPSTKPSLAPSITPSSNPSASKQPSSQPSFKPSKSENPSLSVQPSLNPSGSDNPSASIQPSMNPSTKPSLNPSQNPSTQPSNNPSLSLNPSQKPSTQPSLNPSSIPSQNPSAKVPADLDEIDNSTPDFDKPPDNDIVFDPLAEEGAETAVLAATDSPTMAPVEPVEPVVADDDDAGDDDADDDDADDDDADDDDSERRQQ